jgi:hypothetical protein
MMRVFGRGRLAGLKAKNLKTCARSTLLPVSIPKLTACRYLGATSHLSDPPQEAFAKIEIDTTAEMDDVRLPAQVGNANERDPYWQKIPIWKDVPETDFLSYQWQVSRPCGFIYVDLLSFTR